VIAAKFREGKALVWLWYHA